MDNFQPMTILYSTDNLLKNFTRLIFIHPFLFYYVVEKLALTQKLHHQKKIFWGLDNFVKLNDVRMADKFENVDLTGYTLNVSYVNYLVFL